MVRLTELEDNLSQEDETETRRTLHNHRRSRPNHILIKTSDYLANPQRFPCDLTATIQRKRHVRKQLHKTTTGTTWSRRSVWNRDYPKPSKTRTGISISHQMDRLSYFRRIVGTRIVLFKWWRHPQTIQTATWTQMIDLTHLYPRTCLPATHCTMSTANFESFAITYMTCLNF